MLHPPLLAMPLASSMSQSHVILKLRAAVPHFYRIMSGRGRDAL